MKTIASFTVDHQKLGPGLYISRQDGDVITYDLRMTAPNREAVLTSGAMHALEHIGATYLRNSPYADKVLYFGPMGCRTGFYLLLRDSVPFSAVKELLLETYSFIGDFRGDIPGASAKECGNYLDMDLAACKTAAKNYLPVLAQATDGQY